MTDKEKVLKAIDGLKDEAIDLMKQLIAINSIGPENNGPGEGGKAAYLMDYFKKNGFHDINNYPASYHHKGIQQERPNLVVRFPGERPSADTTFWILSHLDVVPEGDLDQWQTPPFEAVVKGGKIFGRGSEDNLQGLVASVLAARAFIESDVSPAHPLALALVSDEETGSKYGLNHLLENHTNLFSKKDLYLVPDAGSHDARLIEIAEKSILWLAFKTTGKQVHASTPHLGKNAFKAAAFLITRLENLYQRFPVMDQMFDPPASTFEPTKKQANVPNINTIPGEDLFYFDCRVLPCYDLNEVMQRVAHLVQEVEKKFQVSITVNYVQKEQAAPATAKDAPIVNTLKKAIMAIYGVQAESRGIGGGTVAALFRKRGFPTAVWATLDDMAHQPNEYCIIDNLIKDAKVFCLVALG
jgi:succinyl-diaminopimelate desuccinylase